ncbi:hypothetical protein LY76DRAFT_593609 [Colletotrichum caudatum]|nr:hypothetical protein LY76DRAFT_593609 [Colletotrichum caudatum]
MNKAEPCFDPPYSVHSTQRTHPNFAFLFYFFIFGLADGGLHFGDIRLTKNSHQTGQ